MAVFLVIVHAFSSPKWYHMMSCVHYFNVSICIWQNMSTPTTSALINSRQSTQKYHPPQNPTAQLWMGPRTSHKWHSTKPMLARYSFCHFSVCVRNTLEDASCLEWCPAQKYMLDSSHVLSHSSNKYKNKWRAQTQLPDDMPDLKNPLKFKKKIKNTRVEVQLAILVLIMTGFVSLSSPSLFFFPGALSVDVENSTTY